MWPLLGMSYGTIFAHLYCISEHCPMHLWEWKLGANKQAGIKEEGRKGSEAWLEKEKKLWGETEMQEEEKELE